MDLERIALWDEGEYTYPAAFGFRPGLTAYPRADGGVRPGVLVVPGGAYCMVSPTEAAIVAEAFRALGFHAFVLTYTTNPALAAPLRRQPMRDLSRALRLLRSRAAAFRLDPGRLAVCGFSAGGHLCGCVCERFEELTERNPRYAAFSNRPDAAIFGYSAFSTSFCAGSEYLEALLGPAPAAEELDEMSLERHVSPAVPPCFLWHTAPDDRVPVSESLRFAAALRDVGAPWALHVFSEGKHGMSVATEAWARGEFGPYDTCEQAYRTAAEIAAGRLPLSPRARTILRFLPGTGDGGRPILRSPASAEVAAWPSMAAAWLRAGFSASDGRPHGEG